MKKFNSNILTIVLFSTLIFLSSFNFTKSQDETLSQIILPNGIKNNTDKSPNSIKMYNSIEKFARLYNIPLHIAYNVAYLETTYEGPFDWNYNQKRVSKCGALGPMQIMPSTAKFINQKKINTTKLKTDIAFNVETSMKYLAYLHERHDDWAIVCGMYNTGHPVINKYAKFCVENKDYQTNWVSF